MKICPVCKSAVPDDAEYCDTCGNDEFYSDYGQQQQFDQYEQPYQNDYNQQPQYQQPYQNNYNQQSQYQQPYQNNYNQQPQYQQPYQNDYNQQLQYQQPYQNDYNQQPQYQQPYQNNYNQQPQYQQPYQNDYNQQPQYQQPYQNDYEQQPQYQQQSQQYQNDYEQQPQYQQQPVEEIVNEQPAEQEQQFEQPVAEEQNEIQNETETDNNEPEVSKEPKEPEEPEEPKENPYEVSKNFVFEKKEPEQPTEPEKKEMPKNIKGFLDMFQNTKNHTHEFDKNDISKNQKNALIACFGITFWYPFIMKDYSRFARYYGNQGLLTLIAMIPSTLFYSIITGVIVCNACVDPVNHYLTLGGWIASVIFFAICYAIPIFMIYCSIKNIKQGKAKDIPFIGGLRLIS